MSDPHGKLHRRLRPRFPFFGHRTLAEVDETEALQQRADRGELALYEMWRLIELRQQAARQT